MYLRNYKGNGSKDFNRIQKFLWMRITITSKKNLPKTTLVHSKCRRVSSNSHLIFWVFSVKSCSEKTQNQNLCIYSHDSNCSTSQKINNFITIFYSFHFHSVWYLRRRLLSVSRFNNANFQKQQSVKIKPYTLSSIRHTFCSFLQNARQRHFPRPKKYLARRRGFPHLTADSTVKRSPSAAILCLSCVNSL